MMHVQTDPILVTGAHRTGTTWVGRLLAASPGLAYISEPLNVLHRPGVFGASVPLWYTYICEENGSEFVRTYLQLLAYRYHLGAELASLRSGRDMFRMVRDIGIFVGAQLGHRRTLIKDPFAVFSLKWFAEHLHCRIVVTVRHPAAFASSLKRLNWSFDFGDLMQQRLLMRDHLEQYRDAMRSAARGTVVEQAGLLWAIVYMTLHGMRDRIPHLNVVRHEDLARDPVEGFRSLYAKLGLEFTPGVQRRVVESSSADNPTELSDRRIHDVKLDSRASLQNWKHRLSVDEIKQVRRLTEGVAQLYYEELSWN